MFVSKSKWREINCCQKGGNNFGNAVDSHSLQKSSSSLTHHGAKDEARRLSIWSDMLLCYCLKSDDVCYDMSDPQKDNGIRVQKRRQLLCLNELL